VIVQLGIQSGLHGDLGDHLPELVEILFRLDFFGCLIGNYFEFFSIRLSILPDTSTLIDSYTFYLQSHTLGFGFRLSP
jgi:hypothetical protein